jgi:hypothetical protein
MKVVVAFLLCLAMRSGVAHAQSLPPLSPTTAVTTEKTTETTVENGIRVRRFTTKETSAGTTPRLSTWLPALEEGGAKAVWGRTDSVNMADQVQFLYGFGGAQRKALTADLFALIFPLGFRVGIGSSVAADDSDDTAGDDAVAKAIERLREGGDMYLSLAYPLLVTGSAARGFEAQLLGASRMNFLIDEFGAADTLTESTERSWSAGLEGGLRFKAIDNDGFAFVSGRLGFRRVSETFREQAKLDSNTFGAMQVAFGVQFNQSVRLSFQRFQAPPAALGVTQERLKGWHLALEVFPVKKP